MPESGSRFEEQIERYIAGDDTVGDALSGMLAPLMLAVVHRVLSPDDPDAEDVVQDSLIAVLEYLRRTKEPPRNTEAFSCTIARNRCLNLVLWRRRRQAADVDKLAHRIPDLGASPLELVEEQSARDLVGTVLSGLDEACRALLEAIYRAETPIEELRGRLGLKSVQAVYYRKDVCIRKAQRVLNQMLFSSLRDEREGPPDLNPEQPHD